MSREGTVMRKQLVLAVLAATLAFGVQPAHADSIALTSGFLDYYLGDLGGADLSGAGFHVSALVTSGSFPVAVQPGDTVDFGTRVDLSGYGQATVNGATVPGNPSGPGAGRLWITGTIAVTALPFIAPPIAGFAGEFQTPVTLSGLVTGYFGADLSQPPLFSVNVFGSGVATGVYAVKGSGGDAFYLDTCCAGVTITDPSTPSPTPEPANVLLLGTGMIGLLGHHTWRKRRQP
jgi:hypothetical protein